MSGLMRLALIAAVCLFGVAGCDQPEAYPATSEAGPPQSRALGPVTEPLQPGAALPPLDVEGWLNGSPAEFGTMGVRLTVVDVWASWCPLCRMSAPGLVRLHKKYADRGVAFLSVTNMSRPTAEGYTRDFSAPWPHGYGLTANGVAALRVVSGQSLQGYEIAPTVYLVGADGKVCGADRQGRFHHAMPAEWEKQLDAAIDSALHETPGAE